MGDRPLTDIVYGNINGFLTILTEPLSLAEEPFIVRQVGFFLVCFLVIVHILMSLPTIPSFATTHKLKHLVLLFSHRLEQIVTRFNSSQVIYSYVYDNATILCI